MSNLTSAEIVVLTALPVEYNAVLAHLSDVHEIVHPNGTIYERGTLIGSEISCAVCEIGAHNVTAARETERAISFFKPQIAVFIGVAGGIKDVEIGDVVAATKIYAYESGKANDDFSPRPEVRGVSYPIEQRCRVQARSGSWIKKIIGDVVDTPKVLVAPIAAGASVVASTASSHYKYIRKNYGDAVAVEMEGHGFADAVASCHPVLCMLIRGISDLVDGKSEADESGSQPRASRNAAAFAFDVIQTYLNGQQQVASSPSQSSTEAGVESSGNLLLLGGDFFRTNSMEYQEDSVSLSVLPTSPDSEATLRKLASNRQSTYPFAYGNFGGDVLIASASSIADNSGTQTWRLKLDFSRNKSGLPEAGFKQNGDSFSVDDIAQMRAEWILLGQEPPDKNLGFLRALVSGPNNRVEVCHTLKRLRDKQHGDFLAHYRLVSVYTLLASQAVEHVVELKLQWVDEHHIRVDFKGVRAQVYQNVEPSSIIVSGICCVEPD